MEQREALLDSLAELRAAHDKASRLMTEIAAIGARALKGGDCRPSLAQLRLYEQLAAQAQQHAARCQDLLLGAPGTARRPGVSAHPPSVH